MITKRVRLLFSAALVAALAFAATRPAHAISVSITSVVDNSTQSLTGGGSSDKAAGRQLQTPNPGTSTPDALMASANAATRFIANVAADRGISFSGGTANATLNVNYTVNFQVTPDNLDPLYTYTVDVGSNILGAATQIDDNLGLGNGGSATITAVSGFLGPNPNAALSLASAGSQGSTGNTSGAATEFSGSNLLSLGPFTGVQNFSVRFTWTMVATSPSAANGGDETSVRLGFNDPHGGNSADNYPGVGSRNIANDGHFVNITATMVSVPEPSTFVMAGMAAFGLVFAARRRNRG